MFFVKPCVSDIEISTYGNSVALHEKLSQMADVRISIADMFSARSFWDNHIETNTAPLIVLATGLAPRISGLHQESRIPTGVFQCAAFESLKLQFPVSITAMTHTGPKLNWDMLMASLLGMAQFLQRNSRFRIVQMYACLVCHSSGVSNRQRFSTLEARVRTTVNDLQEKHWAREAETASQDKLRYKTSLVYLPT